MNFEINANQLKNAMQYTVVAASKEKVRYYLNGVYFDKQAGKPLYLVATDGHRLHRIAIELKSHEAMEFNFIMPTEQVKAICTAINSKINFVANMEVEGRDYKLTLANNIATGQGIDGKFPDYARIIPNMEQRKTLEGYNVQYLIDSLTAMKKVCTHKCTAVTSWGNPDVHSPIVFKLENTDVDAIAVIMPMRT